MSAPQAQTTTPYCQTDFEDRSIGGLLDRFGICAGRPLSPGKRPYSERPRLAASCHQQKWPILFDYLIGALLDGQGHVEIESLGRLEIDHQLVFGGRLHRKVGGSLAPEDAVDIGRRTPK